MSVAVYLERGAERLTPHLAVAGAPGAGLPCPASGRLVAADESAARRLVETARDDLAALGRLFRREARPPGHLPVPAVPWSVGRPPALADGCPDCGFPHLAVRRVSVVGRSWSCRCGSSGRWVDPPPFGVWVCGACGEPELDGARRAPVACRHCGVLLGRWVRVTRPGAPS